ncbi:hypothetical protein D3C77_343750 [compost metagenome]
MQLEDLVTIVFSGLLSVLIGWLAGLLGGAQKAREEIARWRRSREDTISTEAVQLIKELATHLASASHSMCWLTWQAQYAPRQIDEERIAAYDQEMHDLQPKILGAYVALVAVSTAAAQKLEPTLYSLFALDARVGLAAVNTPDAPTALAAIYEDTLRHNNTMQEIFRGAASELLIIRS